MFEEAQLFSPVSTAEDGSVTVHLASDHPGASDPVYRERRNAIAAAALSYTPGDPIPRVEYTDEEHEVWRTVSRELERKHEQYAASECREALARFDLPKDHIPQLEDLSQRLQQLTGFRYRPAAGLVPQREFLGTLADGVFHSSQYIRHHAAPLYTPEPDLVHETIGHGCLLASDRFAELKRAAGRAARRVETEEGLELVGNVFWYSIEFGVVREGGELKCYGAGLLSSFGEIEEFRHQELRPLDIPQMATLPFDVTVYQPVLFVGDSLDHISEVVGEFFETVDDDTPARLKALATA